MSRLELRPYQQEAINAARQSFAKTKEPIVIHASVGAGKSLMIASIADGVVKKGGTVLVIAPSMELVEQNCEEYYSYTKKTDFGICCSSLGKKQIHKPVTFATPGSIVNKTLNNPTLILIDECHQGNFEKTDSLMSKIVDAYPYSYVLGLTGTPYRGKYSCYGKDKFFKECVYEIDMHKLIYMGFLTKYRYGGKEHSLSFDNCKIRNGRFRASELDNAVSSQTRITADIMKDVVNRVEGLGRKGCFIFGTTVEHCKEIIKELPPHSSRMVLGETKRGERKGILKAAKSGKLKYLVSKDCLFTGVNIPHFDTIAWLRPTESRVVFVQGNGRALRLSPGKTEALILDYAGNKDRHSDEFQDAGKKRNPEEILYELECDQCGFVNRNTARKCEGCDYLFLFKVCDSCAGNNDITARHCKYCNHELIDPNEKLTLEASSDEEIEVVQVESMSIKIHNKGAKQMIRVTYKVKKKENPNEPFRFGADRFETLDEYHLTTDKNWSKTLWRKFLDDCKVPYFDNMYDAHEVKSQAKKFIAPDRIMFKRKDKFVKIKLRIPRSY